MAVMAIARPSTTPIPVATRIGRFSYAIRNIVVEAQRVEASGRRVRYLNIGDPVAFGFKTPPHLIAAVERALRDGHNGYGPSAGHSVRRARRSPRSTRPRGSRSPRIAYSSPPAHPRGSSSRCGALADEGSEVLLPVPTYPLYTAVVDEARRSSCVLSDRPGPGLESGPRSPAQPRHAGHAGPRRDRSQQPDGGVLFDGDAPGAPGVRRRARPARSSPTRCTAISDSRARCP